MFERTTILARYPWLAPGTESLRVVMGDDLDAALSTALYLHTHPNANLVSVYHKYRAVYYTATLNWNEILDAVWLDLDIYHARCRSLGHHMIRITHREQLPGWANSCNLNELAQRTVKENYSGKYPLGTTHFLMWLYGIEIPAHANAETLIWLADSAYINGQSKSWHRRAGQWLKGPGFRWNVQHWLQHKIPLHSLQDNFGNIDTRAFEEGMATLHAQMTRAGFAQGNGQVASHHLKLSGYQCQPVGEIGAYVARLLQFVAAQTGWNFQLAQIESLHALAHKTGQRRKATTAQVEREGLPQFLASRAVFSYVFQNANEINYTVGL